MRFGSRVPSEINEGLGRHRTCTRQVGGGHLKSRKMTFNQEQADNRHPNCYVQTTVEPRYKEPLYNEVLGITNDVLYPSNSKIYEKKTSI